MTAIRVIFDGKNFVPQEPLSVPTDSHALVLVDDPIAQRQLDDAVRAYYQHGADNDDDAWARNLSQDSARAWEED